MTPGTAFGGVLRPESHCRSTRAERGSEAGTEGQEPCPARRFLPDSEKEGAPRPRQRRAVVALWHLPRFAMYLCFDQL